jgi:hypothetical protein
MSLTIELIAFSKIIHSVLFSEKSIIIQKDYVKSILFFSVGLS